jgi:hypothetical protein
MTKFYKKINVSQPHVRDGDRTLASSVAHQRLQARVMAQ